VTMMRSSRRLRASVSTFATRCRPGRRLERRYNLPPPRRGRGDADGTRSTTAVGHTAPPARGTASSTVPRARSLGLGVVGVGTAVMSPLVLHRWVDDVEAGYCFAVSESPGTGEQPDQLGGLSTGGLVRQILAGDCSWRESERGRGDSQTAG
jgi:hypothetical protein